MHARLQNVEGCLGHQAVCCAGRWSPFSRRPQCSRIRLDPLPNLWPTPDSPSTCLSPSAPPIHNRPPSCLSCSSPHLLPFPPFPVLSPHLQCQLRLRGRRFLRQVDRQVQLGGDVVSIRDGASRGLLSSSDSLQNKQGGSGRAQGRRQKRSSSRKQGCAECSDSER